jgi:hypothetical protein
MGRTRWLASAAALAGLLAAGTLTAYAAAVQVSSDPYTAPPAQHRTEAEVASAAHGSTAVAVLMAGIFTDVGSQGIGWATSTNGGSSWSSGFLPGITVYNTPAGPYDRVADPAVAYDAAHGVWLASSLGITGTQGAAVLVSRSADGTTWGNPVPVAAETGADKPWVACDGGPGSPSYGSCYAVWDDQPLGDQPRISTSTDGGLTWGTPSAISTQGAFGLQPLVQPNGSLVVVADNASQTAIGAFVRGATGWGGFNTIATVQQASDPGSMRAGPLPSAALDGGGRAYVSWRDCRFQRGCKANDVVMASSANGVSWSAVSLVTADGTGVGHLIPALGADPATSGATARLGVAYYYFPSAGCATSACQLDVGFRSSSNGGSTWSANVQQAGPMSPTWLASTSGGYFAGDYVSTSFLNGHACVFFAGATAPSGGLLNEAIFAACGL